MRLLWAQAENLTSLSLLLQLDKTTAVLSRFRDETDVVRGTMWWLSLLSGELLPLPWCCCLLGATTLEFTFLPPRGQEELDRAWADESFGCTGMFIKWQEGLVDVLGTAAAFTASGVLH